jgi:hypothetical protein
MSEKLSSSIITPEDQAAADAAVEAWSTRTGIELNPEAEESAGLTIEMSEEEYHAIANAPDEELPAIREKYGIPASAENVWFIVDGEPRYVNVSDRGFGTVWDFVAQEEK